MAIAGKVAPTYEGDWSANKSYQQHTYVTYNGDCYIAIKASVGIKPTNTEYWFLALKNVAQEQLENIINGTTTVGNAYKLENFTLKQVGESGVRNLIPFPYYRASGYVSNGITYTYGDDGVIYATGTSTATSYFALINEYIPNYDGKVTLSIDSSGNGVSVYYAHYLDGVNMGEAAVRNRDGSVTFDMWEDEYDNCSLGIYVPVGRTLDNVPIKVQVEKGSVAHDYVPYHLGGATDAETLMGISPNGFYQTSPIDIDGTTVDCFSLTPGNYNLKAVSTDMNFPVTDSTTMEATLIITGSYNIEHAKGYRKYYYHDNKGRRYYANEWWGNTPVWKANADGGNADTVDGFHASDIITSGNLLDNPNFKVNQRGLTEYSGTSHTVDRWRRSGTGTTTVADDGVVCTWTGAWNMFTQRIRSFERLLGKNVTLSVKYKDATTIRFGIRHTSDAGTKEKVTSALNGEGIATVTMDIPDDSAITSITVHAQSTAANATVTLEWAKLEYGSVATEFVPPSYYEELLKCGVPDNDTNNFMGYTQRVFDSDKLEGLHASDFAKTTDLANCLSKDGGDVNGDVNVTSQSSVSRQLTVSNAVRRISHEVQADGQYNIWDSTHQALVLKSLADGSKNTFYGIATDNLPLNGGGTVSKSDSSPLILKNTGDNPSVLLGFEYGATTYGHLGFYGVDKPVMYSPSKSQAYALFHAGNSSPVVISNTAPSDTSALWYDTANKMLKRYVDGAWQQ